MGPVGGPEIIILLFLGLVFFAMVIAVIFVVVLYSNKRSSTSSGNQKTSADRIRELDGLLADKLISEQEYQERRASILQEI